MNVQPVDLGDEIRQGVESRLDLAPVVLRRPIAREFLGRRKLHALRCIGDRFPFGPSSRADALAQIGKFRFRKRFHFKRADVTALRPYNCTHGFAPLKIRSGTPGVSAATVAAVALQKRRRWRPSVFCMTTSLATDGWNGCAAQWLHKPTGTLADAEVRVNCTKVLVLVGMGVEGISAEPSPLRP